MYSKRTPDNGQRNCPKHVEFYSQKNKFEKLVHLVGFIIRILSRCTVTLSWFCSQAVSKTVWHIPLLCVQWKTPDDGQRNCPKHVEFYSLQKNKFEKLVHLVRFIVRILSRCTVTWTSNITLQFIRTRKFAVCTILLKRKITQLSVIFAIRHAFGLFSLYRPPKCLTPLFWNSSWINPLIFASTAAKSDLTFLCR